MKRSNIFLAVLTALLVASFAMAATTYTSNQGADFNLSQHSTGIATTVTESYEAPVMIINDVIQMVKVPKNSTVTDVILVVDDLDSGTDLTLSVGTGDNDDYFIVANTVGQAGGLARSSAATAFPLAFTADDTIDVKVIAAAGTSVAGTVNLSVTYIFTP